MRIWGFSSRKEKKTKFITKPETNWFIDRWHDHHQGQIINGAGGAPVSGPPSYWGYFYISFLFNTQKM